MADCYEGDAASAQGTTVSWGGDDLGMLTSVQVRAGRSQLVDVTSVNATVIGSGTSSRVLREVGVASVEPASISLIAYSTGISVNQNDRGDIRMLNVTGNGWSYSGNAILMDYNLTANVGGFVTISMEFQFTGG
ncbi:MAG: hypothetical protein HON07_02375 [Planctomycetaceae bacterium]|nr:hypothetical protein [Planctomycetaceae bacterium]